MDDGSTYTNQFPYDLTVPLPPQAPPSLEFQLPELETELFGSYKIYFQEEEPNSSGMMDTDMIPLCAALIKIEDNTRDDVNYFWLVRICLQGIQIPSKSYVMPKYYY